MPGRLAIDFGTSNTVVAVWDEVQQEGIPLHVPDYGLLSQQGDEQISVVPSLIHYASNQQQWVGNQVLQQNLYQSRQTFRWMKRYINNRSPVKMRIGDRRISHFEAGTDFLSSVLLFAAEEVDVRDEEVALTVPVEAFEHYENWLVDVAEAAGLPRFRLIDEPSAAALGYGAHIQPGNVYLIFDFGGGTLDVAIVLIEEEATVSQIGRRCRVLGKAGVDLGGAIIDQWLFQDVLRQNNGNDTDEDVRQLSNALLVECERAKERLSFQERADVSVVNPDTGRALWAEFTRSQFENILDAHNALTLIDRTIRRALNAAFERGYREDDIKSVLAVGGSSQIPAVQRTLGRIFGRERVMLNRPLDAVARGAASFVAGVDFYDHIQHDYAIRYLNRGKGVYDYRTIVEHGTPYPTTEPIVRLKVKSSYDGQTQLGLALFEMGNQRSTDGEQPLELVFDPGGAARIVSVTVDEEDRRTHFWMNEGSPTFLEVNPPAKQSQQCYEVAFSIDGNKRLLITARNIKSGQITHRDYPVVKLT